MTFSFGTKSSEKLAQVHPDLQRVFNEAIKNSPLDFSITEGLRTKERQKELFSAPIRLNWLKPSILMNKCSCIYPT